MDFRGAQRIDLPLGGAHQPNLPGAPLFSVKRGRTVMLRSGNSAADPCVLHIHGHSVRLLDALDDGWKPVLARLRFWPSRNRTRASRSSPTTPASGCCRLA